MKTSRKPQRILCLLLTIFILSSCIVTPISAAQSECQMNVSASPVKGNLSTYSLPAGYTPMQGETAYLNMAATTDLRFARAEFYVKAPDQCTFTLVYDYQPNGYFRWCYCPYTFALRGTYTVRLVLTLTNGAQASGEICFDVQAGSTPTVSATDEGISISWDSSGKTSTSRNADDSFWINGTEIIPGSIHKTYYANGTQSTSGSAYYCMYNNKLTYVAGAQCMNYVYYLQLLLYGSDSHKTKLYNSETDDGVSDFYGVRYKRNLTAEEFKALLQYTGAGTHLRCSSIHSIFVLKVDENGFYYTDANTSAKTYGANNIKIGYTTYADFASGQYRYLNYVEYYHG